MYIYDMYKELIGFLFFGSWGGVEPSLLLLRTLSGLLYQPQMMDEDECGAVCGIIA
jgi:hypothetical protein